MPDLDTEEATYVDRPTLASVVNVTQVWTLNANVRKNHIFKYSRIIVR